jgi:hypothetical protein
MIVEAKLQIVYPTNPLKGSIEEGETRDEGKGEEGRIVPRTHSFILGASAPYPF